MMKKGIDKPPTDAKPKTVIANGTLNFTKLSEFLKENPKLMEKAENGDYHLPINIFLNQETRFGSNVTVTIREPYVMGPNKPPVKYIANAYRHLTTKQ